MKPPRAIKGSSLFFCNHVVSYLLKQLPRICRHGITNKSDHIFLQHEFSERASAVERFVLEARFQNACSYHLRIRKHFPSCKRVLRPPARRRDDAANLVVSISCLYSTSVTCVSVHLVLSSSLISYNASTLSS